MENAGIGLQINGVLVSGFGTAGQQQLPVVHICALFQLSVDKNQELGIFGVIPFLNLGAQVQPQLFSVIAFRHGEAGAEPIMAVGSIPVHELGIKVCKRRRVCVHFLRTKPEALFYLPAVQLKGLGNAEFFQLCGDDFQPFFHKNHSVSSHQKNMIQKRRSGRNRRSAKPV